MMPGGTSPAVQRVIALPADDRLLDVSGRRVEAPHDATVALWHPADAPELHRDWQRRAIAIELDQPVEQIRRDVTLAHAWPSTSARRARPPSAPP